LKGATAEGDNFVLTVDSPECCSDAANACPVKCIKVEE
jgi:ferredoxin